MSSFRNKLKNLLGPKKQTKILNDINSHVLDGPFIALGLRGPGGKSVWLFGERHYKENTAEDKFKKFTPIDEMLQNHTNENVLIYEGEFSGDVGFLRDAPEEIKQKVRMLLPDGHVDFTNEFKDENGNITPAGVKTDLEKLGYRIFEEDENWSDPGYFEFLKNVGFYADVVAERFVSKRGTVINIDTLLRRFLISNFAAAAGKEMDEDSILKVLNYWFEKLIPDSIFIDETNYNKELYTEQSFKLLINIMKFVKHNYSGLYSEKVLYSVTSNLSTGLQKISDDKVALFKDIDSMKSFASSYVASTMDLRILELVNRHKDSNIITYTGAHHSILFSALLQASGYVLEYSFVNNEADYLSRVNKVDNMRYDKRLDLLRYVKFVEDTFNIG